MNISVRYYTRSGNTKKLADEIASALDLQAENIEAGLSEKADILFLGCSYYAFDMDDAVKAFLKNNKDNIGKIVMFGTSAMMKSMRKPMKKVTKDLGIEIAEEEFHCRGQFGRMHKGRPNADDLKNAAEFAKKVAQQ